MNKIVLASAAIFICAIISAQQMQVKQPNFATFNKQEKKIPALLDKMSSAEAKQHPEYGILPFNSQCRECVELIDKRTVDSRFFIDPKNAGHTWSQKSYFPLHYKNSENDVWHTIDQRLRPDSANPGVYIAKNQPVPSKLDLNKKNTSLDLGELEFSFNNDLTMYFFEPDKAYTQTQKGDYTRSEVGEEGLMVYDMWKGIDMRQMFMVGKIETNYAINSPLDIPVSDNGFMVIEDHFTIPDGYTFEEESPGLHGTDNYYHGDYLLKNEKGEILATYEKPIYTDGNAFGMHGSYNLLKTGNNYTLQMMVPVSWLKNPNNVYPIIIDPVLEGSTKVGNYRSSGGPSASMAFTTYTSTATGYCPYHMTVNVPGKTQLTNTYLKIEWELTFDNTCQASPPAPSPYCSYTQVWQKLVCDSCNVVYPVYCKEATDPNYIGTCTTDPNLVPGADSDAVITDPPFLSCYAPQCSDYAINFTLENSDSVCNESCGYLCARGNMWEVTIEAQTVQGYITQDSTVVCAGQPLTDTAHGIYGVPPYSYQWYFGNDTTAVTADSIFTLQVQQSLNVICLIYDSCGFIAATNVLTDSVLFPGPVIQDSGDTLISSYTTGNQWFRNDTMLVGDTSQICVVTIPGIYMVQAYDESCGVVLSDSVNLNVNAGCKAFFVLYYDTTSGQGIYYGYNLSTGSNLHYTWYFGDGDTSNDPYPTHIYSQAGIYTVCLTVNNGAGCSDTYCDSSFYVIRSEVLMSQLNILAPGSSGTTNLNNTTSVDIYPNPATNELIINARGFQPQQVSIYDVNGREIVEEKYNRKLDINQLATGAYFIEIKGSGATVRKMFEKE